MGQEITHTGFSALDHSRFRALLEAETAHLRMAARARDGHDDAYRVGFELEAWLVDHAGFPNPVNAAFLERLDDPWVVPELARFNVELNGPPVNLGPGALQALETRLEAAWRRCQEVAHGMDSALVMAGILPTLDPADLELENMSPLRRYASLNREVRRLRRGRPIHIDIQGEESLALSKADVMLEAATTSFQVHLQIPPAHGVRAYNASLIGCAPLLAASTNSPVLFGRRLWQETRVPLFEQSVDLGGVAGLGDPSVRRVTFGLGYLDEGLEALFQENLTLYPVLLPQVLDTPLGDYGHLRLHNGTIWRWVRPLVGHDAAGRLQLRLEQRILPSGPSIPDMVANAAFYIGLTHALSQLSPTPEARLPFVRARDNFYAAARFGLEAEVSWLDGQFRPARELVAQTCLPMAREGLQALGLPEVEATHYLDVVAQRVMSGRTGAAWQLDNLRREQGDMARMTHNYLEQQRMGLPVHEWGP